MRRLEGWTWFRGEGHFWAKEGGVVCTCVYLTKYNDNHGDMLGSGRLTT